MKRNVIIIGLSLIIGLAATWVALRNRQEPSGTAATENAPGGKMNRRSALVRPRGLTGNGTGGDSTQTAAGTSAVNRTARSWTGLDLVDADNLSDTDKQLVIALQNALDDDNLQGVTAAARKLMRSTSVPVRLRTATALSWFGTSALPELIEMLNDPDEEVADTAFTATLDAIAEMPEETEDEQREKAEMLAALIATLSNVDSIEEALMHFAGIEDELVIPHLEKLIARAQAQGDLAKVAALTDHLKFTKGEGVF